MKTCREVAVLLSQDVDGDLNAVDRTILQAHLAICDSCRQILHQLQQMEKAFGHMASDNRAEALLTEEAKSEMKKSLERAMDDSESE